MSFEGRHSEDKMCYSSYRNGTTIVGYRFWVMKVDAEKRQMVKTDPQLRIYKIKSKNKSSGMQQIMNSIVSHRSDEEASTFVGIVNVSNEDFKKQFDNYISQNYSLLARLLRFFKLSAPPYSQHK